MRNFLFAVVFSLSTTTLTQAQTKIEAKDAAKHMNEDVVICDKIYNTKFFASSSLTLMDVGGLHPNEFLTLVIKAEDRKKFSGSPDEFYKEKQVCITGKIIEFKGKPEIVITDPAQLKVMYSDNPVKPKF